MQNSGLTAKTNLLLSRKYLLFYSFRVAGMGFAAVGLLVALLLIVQAQMPLPWKIVCSAVAFALAGLSVYFGVRFSLYSYSDFRYRVVCRTMEKDLLEEMAQLDEDKNIRATAAKRVKNRSLLEKIALQDKNSDVRKTAIARLENQSLLAEMALQDSNYEIRKTAAGLVTEEALLEKLLLESKDEGVLLAVALHLCRKYESAGVFPENLGRALKQNVHAARILEESLCPECFQSGIHFYHETRKESTCVLGCGDSIQYVYSDYEYNTYRCDHCGLDSESAVPISLAHYCKSKAD